MKKLDFIDGLRGIAILAVVTFHAGAHNATQPARWPYGWVIDCGSHGVTLFFLISGFCLSYRYLLTRYETGRASFDVVQYWIRRIERIYPPYLFALLLFITLSNFTAWQAGAKLAKPAYLHATALRDQISYTGSELFLLMPDRILHNASFWSLVVEWHWYFLFPVALVLWCNSKRQYIAVVAVVALLALQTSLVTYYFSMISGFLLGIVAAAWAIEPPRKLLKICAYAFPFCGVIDVIFFPGDWGQDIGNQWPWQLSCFTFMCAVLHWPWLRSIVAFAPLRFFGTVSYSVYLIHEPPLAFLEGVYHIAWFIAVPTVLALGVAFWYVCERPFQTAAIRRVLHNYLRPRVYAVLLSLGFEKPIELPSIAS